MQRKAPGFSSTGRNACGSSCSMVVMQRGLPQCIGRGKVLKVKPAAGDQIVEISFEKVGVKKTMANFAPLVKITTEE